MHKCTLMYMCNMLKNDLSTISSDSAAISCWVILILMVAICWPIPGTSAEQDQTDLAISLGEVSPKTIVEGGMLRIPVNITNFGNIPSQETRVSFIISQKQSPSPEDHVIATLRVAELMPRSSVGKFTLTTFTLPPGNYWVGACVMPVPDELITSNNCTDGVEINTPLVDLAASYVDILPTLIIPGRPVTMRVAVLNKGEDTTKSATVRFVLSSNPEISRGDIELVSVPVPALKADERWVYTSKRAIDKKPGTYWIGACLKSLPGDKNTRNNCSQGAELSIVEDAFPDLLVDVVAAGSMQWVFGEPVDLYAEVSNAGSRDSGPATVTFYLSRDMHASDADIEVAAVEIPGIAADATRAFDQLADSFPYAGSYWLIACVSGEKSEIDAFNNCSPAEPIEVVEFREVAN